MQLLYSDELIQNLPAIRVCAQSVYDDTRASALWQKSLSSSIRRFFSQENKKTTAAIATESKGRPGPGLSPLKHPDWLRPTVCALLPCGRRGRQFSERCCGRRAISAVLSGWICTAGSRLFFFPLFCFFPHCDTFCGRIKGNPVF